MASVQNSENGAQHKTCRCGEGDSSFWTSRASENSDKQPIITCPNCQIMKSGPLFISSKGIGWMQWKKRWFILTRISLIFFRNDPNAPPVKGAEPNVTLGGIDLNNSGSVVVKADKKLITVLFPDGREGRTFTLKAETTEDLNEWKTALENALALSPNAGLAVSQNGIFRSDSAEPAELSIEPSGKDRLAVKPTVIGQPVLFALEDADGTPSFLEKALRFIEEYGIKVEGILRQSADVEEVKRRVRDYEQGKDEFSAEEDAHVVGDCVKYVLREMPSSPIPASCCTALVEAFRSDRNGRIDAMRSTIYETFPKPNRLLLQRILRMMQILSTHKSTNRMSLSALAACMAPLLLRPLLAGDCQLDGGDFNLAGGDGSFQLLQAAAAANHAQAIVIILLEEYDKIFDESLLQEGSFSSEEAYTDSEEGDEHEHDELNDNEEHYDDDDDDDDGYDDDHDQDEHDDDDGPEGDRDDCTESSYSGTPSERSSVAGSELSHGKAVETSNADKNRNADRTEPDPMKKDRDQIKDVLLNKETMERQNSKFPTPVEEPSKPKSVLEATATAARMSLSRAVKQTDRSNEAAPSGRRPAMWGRTSARKNLSMETIDYCSDDEIMIQRLENAKVELQSKISKEVKDNSALEASLERRKEALHERRLALENDLEKLREQLKQERNLRASLESRNIKALTDLEQVALAEEDIADLKQKFADLHSQLNNQLRKDYSSFCQQCDKTLHKKERQEENQNSLLHYMENTSTFDEDNVDGHGLPPCSALLYSEQIRHGSLTKSKQISTEHESARTQGQRRHLPPKNNQTYQQSNNKTGPSCTSNTNPLIEDPNTTNSTNEKMQASRRFFSWADSSKRESQDALVSVSKGNIPQPQLGQESPLRKVPSKSEEVGSMSSSALAKLTNRLNFLKERAQLANELESLDTTRAIGPPPRTNSR